MNHRKWAKELEFSVSISLYRKIISEIFFFSWPFLEFFFVIKFFLLTENYLCLKNGRPWVNNFCSLHRNSILRRSKCSHQLPHLHDLLFWDLKVEVKYDFIKYKFLESRKYQRKSTSFTTLQRRILNILGKTCQSVYFITIL